MEGLVHKLFQVKQVFNLIQLINFNIFSIH